MSLLHPLAENVRWLSGLSGHLGTSRLWRMQVKDHAALHCTLDEVLAWDFERVVVGHGEPVTTDARARLAQALAWVG